MHFIKHIIEFDKLHLVWQSPNEQHRTRYIVAQLLRSGNNIQFQYLTSISDFQKAQEHGFDGYPAFNISQEIYTNGVLDAFMRRLPPRSRGDFKKYLEILRLSPIEENLEISDFALLGYSTAKLPGDSFSIIPSFENIPGPFEFLSEVARFRHTPDINLENIELGSHVSFEKEPENPVDSKAIRILLNGKKIGYVIRPLLNVFHQWLDNGQVSKAVIERKNGQPDRPILYLFIEIKK